MRIRQLNEAVTNILLKLNNFLAPPPPPPPLKKRSQKILETSLYPLPSRPYRVFQKFVPIESCTLYKTFYVSLGKIQLG